MKLFTGQVEVRETDIIKVYQGWLEVRDKNGNEIYYENSGEYWEKRESDENGNVTYYENSNGNIIDNRLKEITIEELTKMGYKLKEE